MSFTMNYHKNGKVIPIKMSIWDAFHGVPDRKPRMPKPCTCCGKTHPKKDMVKHFEDENRNQGDGKNDGTKESGKTNNYSTSPPVAWTDEDDKQILKMKAAGSTWADIRDAVDKGSKSQITARYKVLQSDSGNKGEQKKDEEEEEEEEEEEDRKQAEKKAIGEKKKAECLAKNESEGKGKKDKDGKGKADQQKNDKADSKKSQGSGDMKTWADSFDRKKWIAVASKHYDKTGQRISPEMAKKIAEEK